jgi:hypothetical protein
MRIDAGECAAVVAGFFGCAAANRGRRAGCGCPRGWAPIGGSYRCSAGLQVCSITQTIFRVHGEWVLAIAGKAATSIKTLTSRETPIAEHENGR